MERFQYMYILRRSRAFHGKHGYVPHPKQMSTFSRISNKSALESREEGVIGVVALAGWSRG